MNQYVATKKQELLSYRPDIHKPEDLDSFWRSQLKMIQNKPLDAVKEKIDFASPYADVYEIAFDGCDSTVIKGWYLVPNFTGKKKMPCLVHYHGFNGDRGVPGDYLNWLMLGMCVVAVDCRGQAGDTADVHTYQTGLVRNVTSQGILNKEDYYFKFLYLDAIRALDFACSLEEVDTSKIIVEGGSQGGALTLAVGCLDERPAALLCDVPSNCEIQKRVEGNYGSFGALFDYIKKYPERADTVFEVLSYFDIVNMADKISCPVYASVGLMDTTCPAKFFMAAYNRIQSEKEVEIYPFNAHEGGNTIHRDRKLMYAAHFLKDHE